MKNFYEHLVNFEEIFVELDNLELSLKEKHYLAGLVDANLHHTILDIILSHLSEEDKLLFMEHLSQGDKTQIWEFLNSKVEKLEEKIKLAAEDLKVELRKDISKSKKLKEKSKK